MRSEPTERGPWASFHVTADGVRVESIDQRYFVGRPLPVGDTHRSMSGLFPIMAERADDAIAAIASGGAERLLDLLALESAPD